VFPGRSNCVVAGPTARIIRSHCQDLNSYNSRFRTRCCLRNSPKGFEKIALGCRDAATQGHRDRNRRIPQRGFGDATSHDATRFGVDGASPALLPRVVVARQPWAVLRKPFGLDPASDSNRTCGTHPAAASSR
jgi:hypothetical protein